MSMPDVPPAGPASSTGATEEPAANPGKPRGKMVVARIVLGLLIGGGYLAWNLWKNHVPAEVEMAQDVEKGYEAAVKGLEPLVEGSDLLPKDAPKRAEIVSTLRTKMIPGARALRARVSKEDASKPLVKAVHEHLEARIEALELMALYVESADPEAGKRLEAKVAELTSLGTQVWRSIPDDFRTPVNPYQPSPK